MYYGACVVAVSGETNADNNCSVSRAVTVGVPDLVVSSFIATPANINSGVTVTLSAIVRNSGDGVANSTTLRYYRSSNNTISDNDTLLTTDPVSSLAAGSSVSESASVTGHSSGIMYYGACVVAVSGESSTINNCSDVRAVTVGTGGNPDLVVSSFTASPTTISSGGTVTLSATVRNSGSVTSNSTTLRYYSSSTSTISTSNAELATDLCFKSCCWW